MLRADQSLHMSAAPPAAEEAAAIVAAVERFLGDHAPVLAPRQSAPDNWTQQALLEGVTSRDLTGYSWGERPLWATAP